MANKEENIDRFVKKVISHYDVHYDETHWQALEKQLDAEMPVSPISGTGTNIPTVIVSVLGGMVLMLGILWVSGSLDERQEVEDGNTRRQSVEALTASDSEIKNEELDEEFTIKDPKPEQDRLPISYEESGKSTARTRIQEINPVSAISTSGIVDDLSVDKDIEHEESYSSMGVMDRQGEGVLVIDVDRRTYHHVLPVTTGEDMVVAYPYEQMGGNEFLQAENNEVIANRKSKFQFGVSVGVAPDFNSAGMKSDKTISGQIGIQLFTTYKQRFSISAGVFYGKKKYTVQGEEYYPPSGYWSRYTNGVVPMEVIGTSNVIDIPINLTYNWNPSSRLQFLSSLGVSSYYILSEDCWYKFQHHNPGSADRWDTEEMVKNMFGVGNISLGMLWYIKPKLGLKVEPYLKVPLKDFGWGKINLYSAGTLISVQYTFN